jgi:hypothetical protein
VSFRTSEHAPELDGEGSHRAMVQSKLAILVLFYDHGGAIYSL